MIIFIDPYKMAKRGETMQDSIAVSLLPRVKNLLASEVGEVKYQLAFGVDSEGFNFINGKLEGLLTFCCQRCLQPVEQDISCSFAVCLVKNDSEAKDLPSAYEPVLVDGDGNLDPIELLEDELILALPLVAMHAVDAPECKKPIEVSIEETENKMQKVNQPFGILRDLKLNKKGQSAEDM